MTLPRLAVALLVLAALTGCSLVALKSPERPLSTRDQNARMLTRQYAADYIVAVQVCADEIAARDEDLGVQRDALLWKITLAGQAERAALQLAPMMALLDTWTVAAGMKAYLAPGGAGATVFGRQQPLALAFAERWDQAIAQLARQLLEPRDYRRYAEFVSDYVSEYPYVSLKLVRPSVVQLWLQRSGSGVPLLESTGTIPEALADTADRLQMLTDTLPERSVWQAQYALEKSGLSAPELRAALRHLDERLGRMSSAAEDSPKVLRQAVADVRDGLLKVIERLDASSGATLATLRSERLALSATISSERAAVLGAADAQRRAIALDVADIARQVVSASGQEARRLAWVLGLIALALAVVLLGLPFAAGYLLGRARAAR